MRAPSQSQDELAAHPEALQRRVSLLEKTLAEMEETDRLRDRASAVLKEELAEMRRREKRGHVDVSYIKGVSQVDPHRRDLGPTLWLRWCHNGVTMEAARWTIPLIWFMIAECTLASAPATVDANSSIKIQLR